MQSAEIVITKWTGIQKQAALLQSEVDITKWGYLLLSRTIQKAV